MRLVLASGAVLLSANSLGQAAAPVTPRQSAPDRPAVRAAAPAAVYDEKVAKARALLKAGDARAALAASQDAIALDDKRWEAFVTAASAYSSQSLYDDAVGMLQAALARAPEDRKPPIRDAIAETRRAFSSAASPPSAGAAKPPVAEPPAAAPTQAEIVLWKSIENSTNAADFYGYLDKYPNGTYASVAKARISARLQVAKTADQKAGDLVAKIVALTNNVKTRGETQNVFASGCVLSVVRMTSSRSSTQTLDLRGAAESNLKVNNEAGAWEVAGFVSKQEPGSKNPSRISLRAADQAGVSELYATLPEAIQRCRAMTAQSGGDLGPTAAANKGVPAVRRLTDPRQAAFAGTWRCTERANLDYRDGRRAKLVGKQYYEVDYVDGQFAMERLSPRWGNKSTFLADGVTRIVGEDEFRTPQTARWEGNILVVTTGPNSGGASSTSRYQVADGNLAIESTSDAPEVRVTRATSCGRLSRQDAAAAISQTTKNAEAAFNDVLQFIRSNAVRVSNVERSDPDECEVQWIGPGVYPNDPVERNKFWFITSMDYPVDARNGGYLVGATFWFRTSEAANRYIQLAQRAAELCEEWRNL